MAAPRAALLTLHVLGGVWAGLHLSRPRCHPQGATGRPSLRGPIRHNKKLTLSPLSCSRHGNKNRCFHPPSSPARAPEWGPLSVSRSPTWNGALIIVTERDCRAGGGKPTSVERESGVSQACRWFSRPMSSDAQQVTRLQERLFL